VFFLNEKCVDEDSVYIMQELKAVFQFLCDVNKTLLYFASLHFMYHHNGMLRIKFIALTVVEMTNNMHWL
jgi:hypothetical protein